MALFISKYPRTFASPNAFSAFGGRQPRRFESKPRAEPPPPPPMSFAVPEDPGFGPQPAGVGTPAFFKQVEAKERGLRAENIFGIGPRPLLPGSALPQRKVGVTYDLTPSTDTYPDGVFPEVQTPRNVFTTAPEIPAKVPGITNPAGAPTTSAVLQNAYNDYVDKVKRENEIALQRYRRDYKAAAEYNLARTSGDQIPLPAPPVVVPPLPLDEWKAQRGYAQSDVPNPAFAQAQAGLSETERDFLKMGGAVPTGFGGKEPKSPKTVKDIVTRKMSDGKTYRIAIYGDDSEQNLGAVGEVDTRQQERIVHSPDNPDIQRREFSYRDESGKLVTRYGPWEWTPAALARKMREQEITGRAAAQTGKVTAINAGAAGAPLVRTFGEQGVTTFSPSAGFDTNAPAGSAANPYGAQGPSRFTAEVINERNALNETVRLQNAARAPVAASRVMADAQSGRLAQQAATPAGKAMLTSILAVLQAPLDRQRENPDDDALVAEAVKALEASLAPTARRQFVLSAGSV